MANFWYTYGRSGVMGAIDLSSDDIRVLLVMASTTADTDEDAEFIASFGTLDEFDGNNYVRKALASESVTPDTANNRAEFDATDVTWTALGASGTGRQLTGAVIYKYVSSDADHIPIAYIDDDLPMTPGGGDVILTFNTEGILQI